jgi:hypothetical protein
MLSNRITTTQLTTVGNYVITLEGQDETTFSIQISDTRDNTIIVDLPLDPMDNTLAGTISADAIKKMGNDAQVVLEALSKTLQEKIGAKEFVLLPAGYTLPGFVPVQDHTFKRMRQGNRKDIIQYTDAILHQYADLAAMLDQQYNFVVGVNNIRKQVFKFEQRVFDLFIEHANFTEEKMIEYKSEGIPGAKSRLNNSNVTVVAMLDKQSNLCGMLRSLAMGGEIAYLSDEIIIQNIISLDKFLGATDKEKAQNRGAFLLAYFANRAVSQIGHQEIFVIIAAAGRESIYEAIGFQALPINSQDYTLTIKLGASCLLLNKIKKQLITPPSNMMAVNQFGAIQSADVQATQVSELKHEEMKAGLK